MKNGKLQKVHVKIDGDGNERVIIKFATGRQWEIVSEKNKGKTAAAPGAPTKVFLKKTRNGLECFSALSGRRLALP